MKKSSLLVMSLFFLALVILVSCGNPSVEKDKKEEGLSWTNQLDKTLVLAKKSGNPILIDFYTDWCSWCKRLDKDTFQDSTVMDFLKDFHLVKINAEKQEEVAKNLGIVGYPTVVLCDSEGEEIDRLHYAKPDEFIQTVKDYLNDKGTLADLLRQEKERPEDMDLKFEIADKYIYRSMSEKAVEYYNKIIKGDVKEDDKYQPRAYMGVANAYCRAKEYDKAKGHFAKVLSDYPDFEEVERARYYLGYIAEKQGDNETAKKHWKTCMLNVPDSAGKAYFKKKLESLDEEKK